MTFSTFDSLLDPMGKLPILSEGHITINETSDMKSNYKLTLYDNNSCVKAKMAELLPDGEGWVIGVNWYSISVPEYHALATL